MQSLVYAQTKAPRSYLSLVVLCLLTIGWVLLPTPVRAQLPQPYLVKETNTRTLRSDPIGFTGVNGIVYFAAADGIHGSELWRSDGTAAGTWLVKDLWPGWEGSLPGGFQAAQSGIFYFLSRSSEGNKNSLWRSDGTTAGTQEVLRDYITWFHVLKNDLYFARWSVDMGEELWKTDGTPNGAKLVKDIYPGAESSHIQCVLQLKEALYCSADDGTHGRELWRTDGTEQGTYLVKDINPSNQQRQTAEAQNEAAINSTNTVGLFTGKATVESATILGYKGFIVKDGFFYFTAYQPASGYELWKSDGTAAGTLLVQDLLPGPGSSQPQLFIAAANSVYFTTYPEGAPSEVWRIADTANGALKLSEGTTYGAAAIGDTLFFVGGTTTGNMELWQSDDAGPRLVKDIFPGPTPSAPTEMTVLKNQLYFFAQDESHGVELWVSDGTEAGTQLFKDIFLGASNSAPTFGAVGHEPVVNNGVLYFRAMDPVTGYELWKSDGTLAGTTLVKDIHNSHNESGQPAQFAAVNDTLYFTAINNLGKRALWQTNATATDMAEVMAFDEDQYLLSSPIVMSDTLYFAMMTAGSPVLVHIAGEQRTEIPLQSTQQGEINCCFYPLMVASGKLYFIAVYNLRNEAGDLIRQEEALWVSDGTDNGTQLIKQLPRALFLSQRMVVFQDQLYFLAAAPKNEDSQALALWRSDGTTAGTVAVRPVPFINNPAQPPYFTVASGTLYFIALGEGEFVTKLWRSDGTTAGTESVAPINISPCVDFTGLTVYQNALYFCAADPEHGAELWKSDGTATGTILVKDINPGPADSHPQPLQLFNNQLYFAATDAVHGRELWHTDGVGEGTTLFLDLTPGANSSAISAAASWHNQLYFTAKVAPYPQNNGLDLWRSNDTGTSVQQFTQMGVGTLEHPLLTTPHILFFVGYTPAAGSELWAINTAFDKYIFLPLTSD